VKVVSLQEAVGLVPDGGSIGTGGILMTRKPVALLDAVARARKQLTLWTLLGSVDVELLALHGALAQADTIYVGFEQLGFAPAFSKAVEDGTIEAREYSELIMLIARASTLVIVSVEKIVDEVNDALLFAHEVDAIVEAPHGAKPTALPGAYPADLQHIGRYLRNEVALT
jgi:glutaconate CoA-transferase subunit A